MVHKGLSLTHWDVQSDSNSHVSFAEVGGADEGNHSCPVERSDPDTFPQLAPVRQITGFCAAFGTRAAVVTAGAQGHFI